MSRLRKALNKTAIFVRWPVLSFLILQMGFLAVCDDFCTSHLIAAGAIFFVVAGLHFYFRRHLQYLVLVGLVGVSIGLYFLNLQTLSPDITPKPAQYTGVLDAEPEFRDELSKVTLTLTQRVSPVPAPVSGRIQLTVVGNCGWSDGSEVTFTSAIKEPMSYQNPGVFQYHRFLQRKNIWGTAFVEGCDQVTVGQVAARTGLNSLRHQLKTQIAEAGLKNPEILSALLLGTKTINKDTHQKIRHAGLSHLFVISGLHFGIMSLIIYGILNRLLSVYPRLFLYVPKQKLVSAFTLVFVLFFLGLVNSHPSVLRAGLMIGLYLLSVIFERQRNILHVVLLSAAILLFFNPMQVFDLGFQLSYLSVLTLVLVLPRQLRWIKNRTWVKARPRWQQHALQMVWVTWLLNLMLLPLVLHDFGSVSLNGLLQNIWAIPFFEFLVVPVGLLFMVTSLLGLNMAPYILEFWDGTINLFWLLFEYFEAWSLPALELVSPHLIHLWVLYLGIFLFFFTNRRWILSVTAVLLVATVSFTYYQNHLSYDFRITQIDVGQGDAILIQTPEKNVLVDAGGHRYRDIGSMVLLPTLKHMWVQNLDLVVITHGDMDHYKGLSSLVGKVPIGEVWVNDLQPLEIEYAQLLQSLHRQQIPVLQKGQPEELKWQDGTKLSVLSPGEEMAGLENKNDHSVVLKFEKQNFKALFTGDISEDAERKLVEKYKDELQSDFLKVPHHGSRSSTSQLLLGYVQPKIASIGVRQNSPFGHPTPEVLEKLKASESQILRTDQDGQVQVSLKNNNLKIWKFKN